MSMVPRSIRNWLLYAAAWAPYGASYLFIFRLQNRSDHLVAVEALLNILPAALLGVLVLRVASGLGWPARSPLLFWLAHMAASLAYAFSWWGSVQLLLALLFGVTQHQWKLGSWSLYAAQWQIFSGLMVYGTLAGFAYTLAAQQKAQVEERRRMEAEALRVRSDLSALRSQLNPHFLFNTLHSVIALVGRDPAKAESALLSLSGMLRYALASHADAQQDEVSLREELEFTEAYLALETLRLGDRLRVERDIAPETLALELPSLTLQPLVENAVKHSIAPRVAGGIVAIRAFERDGELCLEVSDDGVGATRETLEQGRGLGLKTVRRRLELYYRAAGSMTITSGPGFTVALRLPQEEHSSALQEAQ